MPVSNLSEALKEAYAGDVEKIIYHTLELRHPAFTQPIRVVRDHANLTARLEDSAPEDAGELVEFQRFAFDLQPPEINERGMPELQLTIDNVSRDIVLNVELAVVDPNPITAIYRTYLEGHLDAPQNDPPMAMTLRGVTADVFQVTARAGFEDLSRAAFPRRYYTLSEFPGLAR